MGSARAENACAGYLLVGGNSTRMGRDKALLPFRDTTLAAHLASLIREAAGNVTLIGPPARYSHLDLPVIPDSTPDCGPLGGLYTALHSTTADWNLIVACDMPGLSVAFLRQLLETARASSADAVVPESAARLHPLCAAYHRSLFPAVESVIRSNSLKMHDFLATIRVAKLAVADPTLLRNVNTPESWEAA